MRPRPPGDGEVPRHPRAQLRGDRMEGVRDGEGEGERDGEGAGNGKGKENRREEKDMQCLC